MRGVDGPFWITAILITDRQAEIVKMWPECANRTTGLLSRGPSLRIAPACHLSSRCYGLASPRSSRALRLAQGALSLSKGGGRASFRTFLRCRPGLQPWAAGGVPTTGHRKTTRWSLRPPRPEQLPLVPGDYDSRQRRAASADCAICRLRSHATLLLAVECTAPHAVGAAVAPDGRRKERI